MPEPPGEVVEVLVLLATYEHTCCNMRLLQHKSRHSGANVKEVDLPSYLCERVAIPEFAEGSKGLVSLRKPESG